MGATCPVVWEETWMLPVLEVQEKVVNTERVQ